VSSQEKGPFLLIYERLYVIAIVTAVALVAAYLMTGKMEPTYRSQAKAFMSSQSDPVSLRTEEGNLPTGPKLPTASTETQDSLLGILESTEMRNLVATRVDGRDSEWLKKHMKFEIDKFNFIVLTALDPDAKVARVMAEEYLRAFRDKLDSTTKERVALNLEMLVDAVKASEDKVAELEEARLVFLQKNKTVDFQTEISQLHQDSVQYRDQLLATQASLQSLLKERTALQEALAERDEFIQGGYTETKNPRVEQIKTQISAAKIELATLRLEFRDKHPSIVAKLAEIGELETSLSAEDDSIESSRSFTTDSLRTELEGKLSDNMIREKSLESQEGLYQGLLEATETRLKEMIGLQASLQTMEADINTRRATLADERARRDELRLYMDRRPSFLITAEAPAESASPFYPIMWLNLLVAGVLGFAMSICLVIMMSSFQRYREKVLW